MKKILLSFLLNLFFSVFELIGGMMTNSVSIMSDAIHDLGDAMSIGLSYLLEKKSKDKPSVSHTYGYARYSVLSATITSFILIIGSIFVIRNAIMRLIHPETINYDGMIIFAVVGAIVNFIAAYSTRHAESLNEKAINLHMLEDVLGWVVVLIGAIIMKLTNITFVDPVLSILIAAFILYNATKTLMSALHVFMEKTPDGIDVKEIEEHIKEIQGVEGVHHLHIWTLDGYERHCCTLHIVSNGKNNKIKDDVRAELAEHNISHVTIEIETEEENCHHKECEIHLAASTGGHHHHHHGHSHNHAHGHGHNHNHNHDHRCEDHHHH